MDGVEILDRNYSPQEGIDAKQEQEEAKDISSSNKSDTLGLNRELDMMQLDDPYPYPQEHDVNRGLLTDDHIGSPSGKSAEFDLSKLCDLIAKASLASFEMDGKDVILFLGTAGSGKTSTMLYLAGTKFIETDDGDFEIESLPSSNHEFEGYKVSGRSRSCTRCLQTTTIIVEGRDVVLCDTPGFGDTEGHEFYIANGILMVQALYRAKAVKPVLVFNKGWQSDRSVSLTETLQSVLRLTGRKESLDFSSFRFVFTDCNRRKVK